MSFTSGQLATFVNGELHGMGDVACSGVAIDTRETLEGKVFFALQGEHADGHDYVEEAVTNGCSAVVVERACAAGVPEIVVEDARSALFQLAKTRREVMEFGSVIAVTGSVGKTTTKDILGSLLGDNVVVSRKSFNNDLGVPLTVLEGELANFLVAEIGANDVGEIEPLAKLVRPDIAILTSIEKAHLEGFGDQTVVLEEKVKLLQEVHSSGYVVIPDTIEVSMFHIAATVVRVGKTSSADVLIETGIDEHGFATLLLQGERVTLSLLGEHNAFNAALAIVAAQFARTDISLSDLLRFACDAVAPEGRLRKVTVGDITFLDDSYNANPASMRSALQLFSRLPANRKVMVLGDMLELGASSHVEHRLLASVIDKVGADVVVLVGDAMEQAIGSSAAIHVQHTDELDSVAALLKPDDLVLLKGSRGLRLERIIHLLRQTKVLEH